MTTALSEGELKDAAWWCLHHKQNTLYLCMRLQSMIEAMDANDGKTVTVFKNMLKAQLPAFIETATR